MVAVDPYIQPDRQKEVFSDELKGMLPLYLFVKNRGDQKLSLNRSNIALEVPMGGRLAQLNQKQCSVCWENGHCLLAIVCLGRTLVKRCTWRWHCFL
jgi:hypothetical protein